MIKPKPWEKTGTYSLIYDLEEKSEPEMATATLNLGTVINRLSREWICIGSGEKLGEKVTYRGGEIRCSIVREGDLKTLRQIFKKWVQKDKKLENEREMVFQGTLGTQPPNLPLIHTENNDTLISLIVNSTVVQVRFIKENLKFIVGINLEKGAELRNIEVYVCGLVIYTKSHQWEILGRSLIPIKEKLL